MLWVLDPQTRSLPRWFEEFLEKVGWEEGQPKKQKAAEKKALSVKGKNPQLLQKELAEMRKGLKSLKRKEIKN